MHLHVISSGLERHHVYIYVIVTGLEGQQVCTCNSSSVRTERHHRVCAHVISRVGKACKESVQF